MAVNLSDCAAMAAVPVAALAAIVLNDAMSMEDAVELTRGMRDCGERFACPLVGGDTNSWGSPVAVAVTVVARPDDHPDAGPPVRRDGARPGDRLCVSGPLGGSLLARHMRPEPRIETALAVNRALRPHAMIDISDGLAIDLRRICEASGCGAAIHEAALERVIHADAVAMFACDGASPRDHALFDGEDFELVIALPADTSDEALSRLGLTCIGEFTREGGCVLRAANGRASPLPRRGWEHFR
jgi:thiamine-monophosphate kinase